MEKHFCTICGNEGRVLPVSIDDEHFFTCLCVMHDMICLKSLLDKDFWVLASHLVASATKSLDVEIGQEELDAAFWFAACRMTGLGLTPESVENLGQLINEMDDDEDDIDLEMKVLVFAFENNLLGETSE
jgi:hypothetical protein